MTFSDRIERTVLLPVPRERVWDTVTKPEQFARWFGVVSAMDFRVGGAIQFTWENERCPWCRDLPFQFEEPGISREEGVKTV